MTAPPRRAWYGRKRTWAALALWLAVVYPLGLGPAQYAYTRGWVTKRVTEPYHAPMRPLFRAFPALVRPATTYQTWWYRLARHHAASN